MTVRNHAAAQPRHVITREEALANRSAYWVFRRAQDIFFSALALIVLLIPMLIVALLIVIDSPGASPIFTQKRVGGDGKRFRFY